jgi:hypothetical protein
LGLLKRSPSMGLGHLRGKKDRARYAVVEVLATLTGEQALDLKGSPRRMGKKAREVPPEANFDHSWPPFTSRIMVGK